jgi:hypothetical protein
MDMQSVQRSHKDATKTIRSTRTLPGDFQKWRTMDRQQRIKAK